MPKPQPPRSSTPSAPESPSPAASERATWSDEALMVAHAAGDSAAFRVLFERHAPGLLRAISRRVASESDARDILQQTLLNAHRARADFQSDRRLKPWLYAIAMNQTREYHRRRARRAEQPLDFTLEVRPPIEPRRPVEEFIVASEVRHAMRALLDNQREVIELRWFDQLSYEEISQLLGASVSAVRVRAHRGYERLRGELAATTI